ncbi:hypothetical protein E4T48_00672 [Aureobasidium sp. EXF-10727]|nr:hypothetical protein E4T48_00672 [Aureobasidium sp. EXF-10727]
MSRQIKRVRLSTINTTPQLTSPSRHLLRSQNSSPSVARSTAPPDLAHTSVPSMTAHDTAAGGDESLFDNETLSDVLIKFGKQQQLHGHKAVLARRSKYFYKAFSGHFPVASSKEIDLGDDEDPEAIRAMIRHIYDLPYDQMLEENTGDDTAAYSTNEDLMFHIGVFTAADKYDVRSLRPLVVKKFENLMETNWESETFAISIVKLTGPSADHLADHTLTAAAASFCAKNLTKLIKVDKFVNLIQKEEPFTGRLLTNFFSGDAENTLQLQTCARPSCRQADTSKVNFQNYPHNCIICGGAFNSGTYNETSRNWEYGPANYKRVSMVFMD